MTRRQGRSASIPWVVWLAAAVVVLAALTLLAAPVGYRLGVLPLRTALLSVLRWGAYAAAAGAGVSALALGYLLARPKGARRGVWVALLCLVAAGAMFSIPAGYRVGPARPPIHDISTDTDDPPPFVAVVPLNTPGRTDYEGEVIAAQQRQAYPDLQPVMLDDPPAAAFERALAAVYRMRWQLVEADEPAGRIEATDTTFWFGFKDDVAVRIRPGESGGAVVDVRSISRVGVGDLGANANRIRAFLARLQAALAR